MTYGIPFCGQALTDKERGPMNPIDLLMLAGSWIMLSAVRDNKISDNIDFWLSPSG